MRLYELRYVSESKIGGEVYTVMGLFDDKQLAIKQAKDSADKALTILKMIHSMIDGIQIEMVEADEEWGKFSIEVVNAYGVKQWHTILVESYQANEMEYVIEDLL